MNCQRVSGCKGAEKALIIALDQALATLEWSIDHQHQHHLKLHRNAPQTYRKKSDQSSECNIFVPCIDNRKIYR